MIRDLGRALSAAISDSSEVCRTVRRLHGEGYALYLMVDGAGQDGLPRHYPLVARLVRSRSSRPSTAAAESLPKPPSPPPSGREPRFQIDSRDLGFLRSIGIDPTRRVRGRRGKS